MTRALSPLVHGWRAVLPLVAVVCLSPGRASAGCGDYVTILNVPPKHPHAPAQPDHHTTPAREAPPVKPPCHGPKCSGAPAKEPPPPAPVTVTAPVAKDLARLLGPADPDRRQSGSFTRDTSSPWPVRRPSDVFHPPRLG